MAERQCGDCKWFTPGTSVQHVQYGECRRRPPVYKPNTTFGSYGRQFPTLAEYEWCGDFEFSVEALSGE